MQFSSDLTVSLSEWLDCTEIIEMGAQRCRERKRNQTIVSDTTDVRYQVYLWTKMASMRDQGNQGYYLVTWRLEGLVSKKRLVYVATFKTKSNIHHPLLCLLPQVGLTVRPWLYKPLTSVLVCLGPSFTAFTLSPLLPLSCAHCISPFVHPT